MVLLACSLASPLALAHPSIPSWHTLSKPIWPACTRSSSRSTILSAARSIPVHPKDIGYDDEPHASLRPRWLSVWLKAARTALGIWNAAWTGALLVGSALELAGKKVQLFDGIKELAMLPSQLDMTKLTKLKEVVSTVLFVMVVGGGSMLMDVKRMGLKKALEPVWKIGSVVFGFIGGVAAGTWAVSSSTLPPGQATFRYIFLPLQSAVFLYLAPTYIDAYYFWRWAFKTDEGKSYGAQWKEYRSAVRDQRRKDK